MENCSENCEVSKGLRRDVDDLKQYTSKVNDELSELRSISSGRTSELKAMSSLIEKVENTMTKLVGKVDEIAITIAQFNFYTKDEVDKEIAIAKKETSSAKVDMEKKIQDAVYNATHQLASDVEELKMKPIKKWDSIEVGIIIALASGVIGFIIGTFKY